MLLPFDPHTAALEGTHLVEAGAGTGKTYAIETLFVRLVVEAGLTVEQILVVTYTIAATQELKSRIRQKLQHTLQASRSPQDADPALAALHSRWSGSPGPEIVAGRLAAAINDFDRVAIFTIHGFCQRTLTENAFDALVAMDSELQTDPTDLTHEIVEDYWREVLARQPLEVLHWCLKSWRGGERLYGLLNLSSAAGERILPESANTLPISMLVTYQTCLSTVREKWPSASAAMQMCLTDAALNQNKYGRLAPQTDQAGLSRRQINWMSWEAEMAALLYQTPYALPLFKGFEKFTRSYLEKSVKKGATLHFPDFCEDCQRLWEAAEDLCGQLDQVKIQLEIDFLDFADRRLEKKKADQRTLFFEDLLLGLDRVLTGPQSAALVHTLRQRYRAALVDEFQDTDPVQFRIFSALFDGASGCLYLIGDPKQAIYGFRGADIFAYLNAAGQTPQQNTLTHNWRTQNRLVEVVNQIFEPLRWPFLIEDIQFHPARSPEGLRAPVYGFETVFTGWMVTDPSSAKPLDPLTAELMGARQLADEIHELVHDHQNPVSPSDIAVLVRTNKQAQLVQSVLRARGLSAVLYSSGNVFETSEAEALLHLLEALVDPLDNAGLRRALSSFLFDVDLKYLDLLDNAAQLRVMAYRQMLRQLSDMWESQGFYAMLTTLLDTQRVHQRLLNSPQGERRLTNLTHLMERLHELSTEGSVGRQGLIRWLMERMQRTHQTEEVAQMRRDNDMDAIHLITIHKSKGLEFAVVFVAFAWQGVNARAPYVRFHEENRSATAVLDLGSPQLADHRVRSVNEMLAENLRLLYVALTRAKEKCYLMWGHVRGAQSSAMGYLMAAREVQSAMAADPPRAMQVDWLSILDDYWKDLSREAWINRWNDLSGTLGEAVQTHLVTPAGDGRVAKVGIAGAGHDPAPGLLRRRRLRRSLKTGWRMMSYSSLMQGAHAGPPIALAEDDAGALDEIRVGSRTSGDSPNPDDFPKGVRTGLFFHEVLENLNFKTPQYQQDPEWLTRFLQGHGFDGSLAGRAMDLLENLRAASLGTDADPFSLEQLDPRKGVVELPFYLPVKSIHALRLAALFETHLTFAGAGQLAAILESLGFEYDKGHLKGFVDYIFEYNQKYYVVDWKTNFLGDGHDAYGSPSLIQAMIQSGYVLQYHLYALALHQLLRATHRDYDYEAHFGGVYYFFLRGIDPRPQRTGVRKEINSAPHRVDPSSHGNGVFFDRPPGPLIQALGKHMVPGFEAGVS